MLSTPIQFHHNEVISPLSPVGSSFYSLLLLDVYYILRLIIAIKDKEEIKRIVSTITVQPFVPKSGNYKLLVSTDHFYSLLVLLYTQLMLRLKVHMMLPLMIQKWLPLKLHYSFTC